jgi:hypothetical protein
MRGDGALCALLREDFLLCICFHVLGSCESDMRSQYPMYGRIECAAPSTCHDPYLR